tara:strand:- start:344 stop:1474 length:1131 start_codon:yes stop_codon:yes gene_type:complete
MANLLDLYNTFSDGFGGVNKKLVYPLENQSDYLGKITFTPINEERVNMAEQSENLVTLITDQVKEFGKLITDAVNPPDDPVVSGGVEDIYAEKRGHRGKTTDARKSNILGGTKKSVTTNAKSSFYGEPSAAPAFSERSLNLNTDRRIALYLPRAIQIQDTVTYDNAFQLGLIGGAIEAGLQSGAGAVGSALGAIGNEAAGLGNTLLGRTGGMSKEAAGILSGKVAAKIPVIGDAAGGAVRSATGLTTNPNVRAIFKDVPIRNFSFAFQLIPTSQNEAIVIEDIIKTFRTELYPTALRAGGVNVGYRFPNRFLIKVKYNNRDIKGIRFLPVYMQSFNATYNSATGGMHSDGRFSAVDISMTFTETRAISKSDIEGGY